MTQREMKWAQRRVTVLARDFDGTGFYARIRIAHVTITGNENQQAEQECACKVLIGPQSLFAADSMVTIREMFNHAVQIWLTSDRFAALKRENLRIFALIITIMPFVLMALPNEYLFDRELSWLIWFINAFHITALMVFSIKLMEWSQRLSGFFVATRNFFVLYAVCTSGSIHIDSPRLDLAFIDLAYAFVVFVVITAIVSRMEKPLPATTTSSRRNVSNASIELFLVVDRLDNETMTEVSWDPPVF